MNVLTKLVREIVDNYLNEDMAFEASNQGRLGKGLGVDADKAAKIKQLYPKEHIVYKIIDAIENAGDKVITRNGYKNPSTGEFVDGLMQMFDFKTPQALNAYMSELTKSGIIVDKDTAIAKKEKAPSTGQRGRKSSDTSFAGKVRALDQNFKENPNYEPTEDDITYTLPKGLGTEKISSGDLAKIKSRALGASKRGRPAKAKDDELSGLKDAMKESLSEQFRRMHKLAGL